jgi:hypothetical protein
MNTQISAEIKQVVRVTLKFESSIASANFGGIVAGRCPNDPGADVINMKAVNFCGSHEERIMRYGHVLTCD